MSIRGPIFPEPPEGDEQPKPAKPRLPRFAITEPFWWAVIALVALAGAFIFVLLAARI
jgi:hypothetical protein